MKSVVFDTNFLIDFCQSPSRFRHSDMGEYGQILIPSVVLGEYKAGIQNTKRGEEARNRLAQLLSRSSVKTVPVGEKTAEIYAKVFQLLREQGKPIPQNDIWIAAIALQHNLALLSRDGHFDNIPQLRRA